ncbi:MAG: toll/interleukin-1 receptor domain-containing protein [Candidatus Brocadiales bacterium]|nr:toll/interleukin-1 receptor domain-containing protein [Candidatus Brocadiales bacterium]
MKSNKPIVFLSHSKKDIPFIDKLASDLRKCQIECWLDSEEIRAGKPWLKVIFEDGIPTCDVVIVYLTENSIQSKMVKKEIDASLIEQLSENGVSFIPYVNNAKLRDELRSDIRTLQCLEWNTNNYNEILPSVVAEIWHCYMERMINFAVTQEKNRRLELEIELRKQKDIFESTPFSSSEETDFRHIHKMMNNPLEIIFDLWKEVDESGFLHNKGFIGKDTYEISYFESIIHYLNKGYSYFDIHNYEFDIKTLLKENGFPNKYSNHIPRYGDMGINNKIIIDLRSYGFVEIVETVGSFGRKETRDKITQKLYRFNYWSGYNDLINDNLNIKHILFCKAEKNKNV